MREREGESEKRVGRNEDKGGPPRVLAIASFHSGALFTSFARQTDELENSPERETLRFECVLKKRKMQCFFFLFLSIRERWVCRVYVVCVCVDCYWQPTGAPVNMYMCVVVPSRWSASSRFLSLLLFTRASI